MITFTTLGYGDIVPHGSMRLVAASEHLLEFFCLDCLFSASVGGPLDEPEFLTWNRTEFPRSAVFLWAD